MALQQTNGVLPKQLSCNNKAGSYHLMPLNKTKSQQKMVVPCPNNPFTLSGLPLIKLRNIKL
ncbi:MAG: hypothetical protein AAFO69_00155, partial [Bacteroidota bacterium]